MINPLTSLMALFYPAHCMACSSILEDGEEMLCTGCRHELPVAGLDPVNQNPIHKLLLGRVEIDLATALFYFDKKSRVQQLLHNLKYRGQEGIGAFLGGWLGSEMAGQPDFGTIDRVIPVPLHKSRKKERGYNQVEGFGQKIAEALHIPYTDDVLFRKHKTRTQVFMQRGARGMDVVESFDLTDVSTLENKHILLVDDLITTGGTLEGCALALKKTEGIKISIAVMAIAR